MTMIMKIDKEIVKKTTTCGKYFNCLNDEKHILCKVEHCINNVHFLEWSNKNNCRYKLKFDVEKICMCPTRKEIYKKYGI